VSYNNPCQHGFRSILSTPNHGKLAQRRAAYSLQPSYSHSLWKGQESERKSLRFRLDRISRHESSHKGRKRAWTPHQPYLARAMTNHAKHAKESARARLDIKVFTSSGCVPSTKANMTRNYCWRRGRYRAVTVAETPIKE